MDPKLAEIYGTNTPDEADVEKLAAAELADQLAEEEQADLDEVDEDTLEALAQEVLEVQNSEVEEDAPEASNDEEADEGQMKVAEADYLGRVMAHAYVQELRGIDKEAKAKWRTAAGVGGEAGKGLKTKVERQKAKETARWGNKMISEHSKRKADEQGSRALHEKITEKGKKEGPKGQTKGMGKLTKGWRDTKSKVFQFMKEHPKAMKRTGYGAAALGAAGLAAGAYHAGKKKAASADMSAFETLAEQRALEILAENGIDPTVVETEQEKVSEAENAYDVLAGAVEQKAWEMLQEAGYVSDE